MKVRDAVIFLEKSVEEHGLMKTGVRLNRILNLLRELDPELHDIFLIAWYVILYF
jgi:hypothetical protein